MIKTLEIDNNLTEGILSADERIVWSGHPLPGRHLFPTGTDIYGFVFAIFWTAMAISFTAPTFIGAGLVENPKDLWFLTPFVIMPFLFVLLGIGMLLQPLFRYWLAKRTLFVVTSRRALIITDGIRQKIRGFSNFSDIHSDLRKDGSGNLFLGQPKGGSIFAGMPANIRKLGFVGLENVAEVEDHIRPLMRR